MTFFKIGKRVLLPLIFCQALTVANSQGKSIIPSTYLEKIEVIVDGGYYTYYSFSDSVPAEFKVEGPLQLTVFIRWLFPNSFGERQEYSVSVTTDSTNIDVYLFTALPSIRAQYKKFPDYRPSRPKKIILDVPHGTHTYSFLLERPKGKIVTARFVTPDPWSWHLTTSLTNTYDDNVYRYSPEDIDNFVYHRADYRYRMKAYDDFISSASVIFYVTRRFSQDFKLRLRLRYGYNFFVLNRERNYQTISGFLKTTVFKWNYLQIGYFHLPKFLIRPYWDQDIYSTTSGDPETYKDCDFTRNLYLLKLGRQISKSIRVVAFYERDIFYYNPYFTEYDTEANTFGFGVSHVFRSRLQTVVEYAFKRAEAKGYDGPGETKENSDDTDISYEEDRFQGGIGLDISRNVPLPINLRFQYRFEKRYFTTDKSLNQDPFHAGRVDVIHRLSWAVEVEILRRILLLGKYEYQRRDVSSEEKERIKEVKNFCRNRISLGIEFKY